LREYYRREGADFVKIIADLHTHTTYSHGKGSVMENVTAALTEGLRAVGITDHGPRSAPWVRASVRDFAAMLREVGEVDRRTVGIKVLAGAECNIISAKGDLDVPLAIRQDLDIVLAGLHPGVLPRSPRDWLVLTGGNWAARFNPALRRPARRRNTEAVVQAVLRNDIDVITHPGYHLDIDTVALARACTLRDTALEINAHHREMTVAFCQLVAREGCKFVIDSDAHRPADVGNLAHGIQVAEAAGLSKEQVLNADGGSLFEWLERKQRRRRGARQETWAGWSAQPPLDQAHQGRRQPEGAGQEGQPAQGRSYWSDWADQAGRGKVH
jgi:putative hydrolase